MYENNSDTCDKCGGRDFSQGHDKLKEMGATPEFIAEAKQAEKDFSGLVLLSGGGIDCGPIRRLPTGGDGGANLCAKCWGDEMRWRAERNKELDNPFDIVPWLGGRR